MESRELATKDTKAMREEASSLRGQCDRFRKVISAMRAEMEGLHAQIERYSSSEMSQVNHGGTQRPNKKS